MQPIQPISSLQRIKNRFIITVTVKRLATAWLAALGLFLFENRAFSQELARGSLQRMTCKADTSQQYSLYLPTGYDAAKSLPLLIFLDPAARDSLPVEKYKQVADKYDIILAGSMNSRNFNGAGSVTSFVSLYNDINAICHIDVNRTWIAGFSGGARAASSIASAYPEIKGMIACGAGFADNESMDPSHAFSYASIVGVRDMNYGELFDIRAELDQKRLENIMLVFDGTHMWPPAVYFETAVDWLMKDSAKTIPATMSALLQPVYDKIDSGFLFAAWFDMSQLRRIPAYRAIADSVMQAIEAQPGFTKDRDLYNTVLGEEKDYINGFNILFEQQILLVNEPVLAPGLWADKLSYAARMINNTGYRNKAGIRCFEQSWRLCSEYYSQFMEAKQWAKAATAARVIAIFNPAGVNAAGLLERAEAANKGQ